MFFPLCAAALFFLSSSSLLDSAEGNNWPVARFTNGTVGLQNEGGKVMVNSNELHVIGDLIVKGQHLIPPKCMPPGGDKLQYNGTHWFCVCAENWSGETCETPPSPPPRSPPPPPPNPESPNELLRKAIVDCFLKDGSGNCECTYDSPCGIYTNGGMSEWDVSKVTDMRQLSEYKYSFNINLSSWDTSQVTDMNNMFRKRKHWKVRVHVRFAVRDIYERWN